MSKKSKSSSSGIGSSTKTVKSSLYAKNTPRIDSRGWILVTKSHQLSMMNKYNVNEFGIPTEWKNKFADPESFYKEMKGSLWAQLKHYHGWQHRYCTDKKTKLQVEIHISPIYKQFVTGKSGNFMDDTDKSMNKAYFHCREQLQHYVLFHLGLSRTAGNIGVDDYAVPPPTSS